MGVYTKRQRSNMNHYAVFLDVDGVINSLRHLHSGGTVAFNRETTPYRAGDYTIWVPDYMPELIQSIEASSDLYWLTTWRNKANEHISDILGISTKTPVIDDGTGTRNPQWKFATVRPLAEQLKSQGQELLWIEDFARGYDSRLNGTLKFVDTDFNGEGVFLPQHLPSNFLEHIVEHGGYNGPLYVSPPSRDGHVMGERNIGNGVGV